MVTIELIEVSEGRCPLCGNYNINYKGEHEHTDDDEVQFFLVCNKCGSEFYEIHRVVFEGFWDCRAGVFYEKGTSRPIPMEREKGRNDDIPNLVSSLHPQDDRRVIHR